MRILQVDLNQDYSEALSDAVTILKYGGVIVYPTDTVYGIGCNALNEIAVRKIYEIKQRSSKPLPVLVKNIIWAKELVHIKKTHEGILEKLWPGKFTVILPKKELIPAIVTTGLGGLGVRIADHVFVDKLLGKFGYPLVATSANISGQQATGNINEIIEAFSAQEKKPDLIIDVGILPKSSSSVVVDLTADKPKILRVGASRPDELLKILDFN